MNIYEDIAKRTNGEIYIGVVGPVRTGKSTFVKKFMDSVVIPNIESEYDRERAIDETPQSGSGKTIMTTEPKFIPDEAVKINIENTNMRVRLIDCVGYMVNGASGASDENGPRMVATPWDKKPMEFEKAAEFGTRKVICDHSTVGIVLTTDGTITDIDRDAYEDSEKRVIDELKALKKPFVIVLNSNAPESEAAIKLALELEEKYSSPVALVNALDLNKDDFSGIFELILGQFEINENRFNLPRYFSSLSCEHWLRINLLNSIKSSIKDVSKIDDIKKCAKIIKENEYVKYTTENCDLGTGTIDFEISLNDELYYQIMSELCDVEIKNDEELFLNIKALSEIKREFEKYRVAIDEVNDTGYGIVMPEVADMTLEEPESIKQGGGHGIKLRASAPSIHLIRANINTEISPIVGNGEQGEEIVNGMLQEFESDPNKLWESNMFGKSLYELVNDSLHAKLDHISEESRNKLANTLSRVINESSRGLICILL